MINTTPKVVCGNGIADRFELSAGGCLVSPKGGHMDPRLSLVMMAVLVAPFILFGIGAVVLDLSQSRRDRGDSVIASWGELRITKSFLFVGYHANDRRIPLAGVTVSVTETGSPEAGPGAHRIHVIVATVSGESIHRSQPYSPGLLTAARTFEILANRVGVPAKPAVEAPALRWAA